MNIILNFISGAFKINEVRFAFIFILLFLTSFFLHSNQQYDGDSYHYFSALNNLVQYNSFYEGPTFEYLLGNHAFILMYLIFIPILSIWCSPYSLLLVNSGTIILTAIFLSKSLKSFSNNRVNSNQAFLITLLFLLSPLTFSYILKNPFHPDVFYCPLFLLFNYYFKKPKTAFIILALIILNKEESLLLVFLLPTIVGFTNHNRLELLEKLKVLFFKHKLITMLLFFFLILSLGVLFYFRNLNEFHHAVKVFSIDKILFKIKFGMNFKSFLKFFIYVFSPIFFSIQFIKQTNNFKFFIIIGFILFLRLTINLITYANFFGPGDWPNLWTQILLFIVVIRLVTTNRLSNKLIVINLAIILLVNLTIIRSIFINYNFKSQNLSEVSLIKNELHNIQNFDYILGDNKYQSNLSAEIPFLSFGHLKSFSLDEQKKLITDSKYIILEKKPHPPLDEKDLKNHKIVKVFKNLILYSKN